MTKRRDIEEHVRVLDEIRGIMGAMKNLALMESHKLSRALATQHQVVVDIEAAGQDFLTFHPTLAPDVSGKELYLVIGAERGFCGDFNDRLLDGLERHLRATEDQDPTLIVVGRKLVDRVQQTHRVMNSVEGPTVMEEVQAVLIRVIDHLRDAAVRRSREGRAPVTAIYHDAVTDSVIIRPLHTLHPSRRQVSERSYPPLLTLPPAMFFSELLDLYLFSLLHAIFYSALMAESRARLEHLESALQRLERDQADLLRRRNRLRQDEITEEIEVLMLSTLVERPHR